MVDFDVFISFKNSDANMEQTPDSKIAEELQIKLEQKGLHAFFSGNSIVRLGESEYKRAIDSALDSAEVLVVIGTKASYIRSKWVEYEWDSFERDILGGLKKNSKILTYTEQVNGRDLPRTLRKYQNFQIDKVSVDRLANFIVSVRKAIAEENEAESESGPRMESQMDSRMEKVYAEAFPKESRIGSELHHNLAGGERKMQKSVYTSALKSEYKRLKIQAMNALSIDRRAIEYVLDQMDCSEKMTVLDVGCAYGFVTTSRFSVQPEIGRIIAIDNNASVIDKAKDLHEDDDKTMFCVMDVESAEFEDEMEDLLTELDVEKVDIIFASLVIHHLKNPDKVLRKLRKFLKQDGFIIVRGSDDGSKLCYPHFELMEQIIEKTMEATGVSDRLNGRKIYTQLVDAGYHSIRIFSELKDLSAFEYDDREKLLKESFSYRINYFKRMLEKDPDNLRIQQDYEWMEQALEKFEKYFYESNFWYCEYDYLGIGRKN